jgi:glycosyltransferase involved in cell wall biosynthesis
MSERRYRLLCIATHPVQYQSPLFREMARHPRLQIEVAYCSLHGAEAAMDQDFGREVKWDVPLLDGYHWTQIRNRAVRPGLGRFFGLVNTELWRTVRQGRYDAVVIYTGYRYASFWIATGAAKFTRTPVLFGTDAATMDSRSAGRWRASLKRRLWPRLFRLADQVIVPSTRTKNVIWSLGIPDDRITLTPYTVNNDWWRGQAATVDRQRVRDSWQVPADAAVVLFCAKLQPWKRPLDLLNAFTRANCANAFLIYAGDGPLLGELQSRASASGVADRVRFLGFVNQSQLPAVYTASDLLVLPSEYEPFGVVVNEAMLCGCVAIVSDRVGAGTDLVHPENGFVFPCGDIGALADRIRTAAANRNLLEKMKQASQRLLNTWSPNENIQGLIDAVETAMNRRKKSSA